MKLENCFLKIGVSEKIFGWNIRAKIFLVGKLVQKVGIQGQILSWKIGVENFLVIFQLKDKFQIFNFSGKIFCSKIGVVKFRVEKLV